MCWRRSYVLDRHRRNSPFMPGGMASVIELQSGSLSRTAAKVSAIVFPLMGFDRLGICTGSSRTPRYQRADRPVGRAPAPDRCTWAFQALPAGRLTRRQCRVNAARRGVDRLDQAKFQDFTRPSGGLDVRPFEVAVDDARVVRRFQPLRECRQMSSASRIGRAPWRTPRERLSRASSMTRSAGRRAPRGRRAWQSLRD